MRSMTPKPGRSPCRWIVRKTHPINGHLRTGWFLVRPQSVKILRKETYLTEGQKVHIVCEVENNCNILMKSPITFSLVQAQGSEPPAQIRWYLGESPQDNFKVEVSKSWIFVNAKSYKLWHNLFTFVFCIPISCHKFQHKPLGSTTKSILIFEPGKISIMIMQ